MLRRLWDMFRRERWERELDDELRFHLDSLEAGFRAQGMSEAEARLAARREFGAMEPMKERYRDRRGLPWLETLWRDLRFGARMLGRSPGFTAVAVLTLALGLGANTAIFTLVRTVLLRSMAVERPEQLAVLSKTGRPYLQNFPYPFYKELRGRKDLFVSVAASGGAERNRLRTGATASIEEAWNEAVSSSYFSTLGVRPELGRLLSDDDETAAGANPVAVLSYEFWRNRMGGDTGVLGRRIQLNGTPLTVVGVASRGFRGLDPQMPVEVWYPVTMLPDAFYLTHDTASWLTILGRRREEVSPEQIRAAADVAYSTYIQARLRGQTHPWKDDLLAQRVVVRPGAAGVPRLREQFERPLAVLMGIVVLVLLITCANVGNLLIARGAARSREMAIRLATGATRGRLLRQLFTESLLLAAAGAVCGLLVATGLSRVLVHFLPDAAGTIPLDIRPDGAVLLFSTGTALAAAVLFGLLPAWRSSPDARGKQGLRLRRTLVAAQVALSLVVLAGAALFVETLSGLRSRDAGFTRGQVLTFWLDLPRDYSRPQAAGLNRRILDKLSSLPGAVSVSCATPGPFRGGRATGTMLVHGQRGEEQKPVDLQVITPGYFTTLGTPLIAGRLLEERDRGPNPGAVLVNEAFVTQHLNGVGAVVGRRIGLDTEKDGGPFVPIAGVVRNVLHQGLREAAIPVVYLPMRLNDGSTGVSIQIRGGPGIETVRCAVREVESEALLVNPRLLSDRVDDSLARERLLAALSGFFAVLALLLAAVGLYGVMAYSVSRRTREIGIRVALGARRGEVSWMIVREALLMTACGAAVGLPGAYFAWRLAAGLLYGVKPGDPATMAFAAAVLVAAGTIAALLPARRAAGIEPAAALRCE